MKQKNKVWDIALGVALAAAAQAADVTMYQDDFSGPAATLLNNSAPDIRPGSEVWNAGGNLFADGRFAPGGTREAHLPFKMEQGRIYTFTADVTLSNFTPTNTDWAGISIRTNDAPVTGGSVNAASGPAYIFVRRNGALKASPNVTTDAGVVSSTINLGIILDTTAASAKDWTVSFTTNGVIFAANKPLPDTIINGGTYYWTIGIMNTGGTLSPAGYFDNVLVKEQIPDPSMVGMVVISNRCITCSPTASVALTGTKRQGYSPYFL